MKKIKNMKNLISMITAGLIGGAMALGGAYVLSPPAEIPISGPDNCCLCAT